MFENDETSMFRAVKRKRDRTIAHLWQTVWVLAICLVACVAFIVWLLVYYR